MGRAPKEPLYRPRNTTAHGAGRNAGGDYRHQRHTKLELASDAKSGSMRAVRGCTPHHDYTPLFRFLLSKVGKPWAEVYSEATARLDREEPIYWMVARQASERTAVVRVGESSYYSGLYVTDAGTLQLVDPTQNVATMVPTCWCCTHTFNGVRFVRPWPGAR
ncbi:MAG: hypothetical protein H0T89_27725 [Deltaproteobacteria bacterium]|nr:hypothetical protein [Deltaproteobacteria bacterium]MDQ3296671.1 hypothetical protein [Myxococcota bacterium]